MLTLRPFEPSGAWGAKSKKEYVLDENGERIRLPSGEYKSRKIPAVDWNDQTKAETWRAAWAETANRYLERLNHTARLDHRSYERQGIEQAPTVHLGVAAFQMERRGIRTERGNINREIEVTNSHIRQIRARINRLNDWLTAEAKNAGPNLQDVISEIHRGGKDKAYWRRITDLKTAAKILVFLQTNNIYDLAGVRNKVGNMYAAQSELGGKLNKMDRRMKTLDEHVAQAENLLKHRPLYEQYKQTKPKKQADFYEAHRAELTLFETAERYIKGVMNGKPGLPVKAWKAERAKLTSDYNALYQDYQKLKEEVRQVEIIRRNVENIMREELRERQPRERAHGLEI
jgi:hypothetical protein